MCCTVLVASQDAAHEVRTPGGKELMAQPGAQASALHEIAVQTSVHVANRNKQVDHRPRAP